MKQVQVFKKTLLSVAVVTALGGYGTFSYGLEPLKLDKKDFEAAAQLPAPFMEKIKKQLDELSSDIITNGFADASKAYTDAVGPLATAVTDATKKVEDAKKAEEGKSGDALTKAKEATKKAEAELDKAQKDVLAKNTAFMESLEKLDKLTEQQVFLINGKKSESSEPSSETKAKAGGLESRKETIAPNFDLGSPDKTVTQKAVLDAKTDDEVRDLFTTKKGDDFVAVDYAKVTELNLTKTEPPAETADKVLDKLHKSTTILMTPAPDSTDKKRKIQFKHKTLELSGKNDRGSELLDVTGSAVASPKAATNPSGTYVVSGKDTRLYHEKVGHGGDEAAARPLEKVIVTDGAEFKVNMVAASGQKGITAQHVLVEKGATLAGYKLNGENEEPAHVKVVGATPTEPVVEGKEHRATLTLDNHKEAWIYTDKVAEIKVTGGKLNISSENDKQLGNVWTLSSETAAGEGTLKIDFTDEAKVTAEGTLTSSEGASDATPHGILQGEQITITNSTVKSVLKQSTPTKPVERDGLVTIKGANLRLKKEGSDPAVYEAPGDTLSITGEKPVYANIEDVEKIALGEGATLVANAIGTDADDRRVTELKFDGKATLTRFDNSGNTIFGSKELEVAIAKDQTVIQDINGFKSITLNGGVLEGNLTGSSDGEDGSTVTLTSGEYRGGNIGTVNAINIDGGVNLKPSQTELVSYKNATEKNKTELKPVVFNQLVTVKSSGNPVIHKTTEKPVQAKGMELETGASLSFVLDHSEDATAREKEHLEVTGTLKAAADTKVIGVFKTDSPEQTYQSKRKLYEISQDPKLQAAETPFTVITTTEGIAAPKGLVAESSDPFFLLGGQVVGNNYQLKPAYNTNSIASLVAAGLTDNEANVAVAAQETALSAPNVAPAGVAVSIGAQMDKAISDAGHRKTAEMEQWDPNNGVGMAAVSVHQKTNLSISRHLNSSRTGISTGDMFESQGFWGEYMLFEGEMKEKDGINGYKNKVNGITLGLDSLLNDQLTVGFAFTYGDVKSETKGASREADSKTYMGTLYTGWTQENFFFDTMFSYGTGKADYKRQGVDTSYKGDGDNTIWGARFVAGYNYPMNEWILQPQVEFNYANVKIDDFKEKGGNFAQKVAFSNFEVMELGAGAKLMAEFDMGNGALKPEFTLMGYHDFKDKKPEVEGTYLVTGGKTYTVSGSSRDQNRFLAGLGVSYAMDNNLSFGLNYDYNWLGDYKAHGLVASVRYDF
ncbi:MAG: autotransporter domain-containing protein [Endozoicomonas sp.]